MKTFDSNINANSTQTVTHAQPKQTQTTKGAARTGGPGLTEVPACSRPLNIEDLYVQYLPQAVAWAWRRGAHDPENVAQDAMLKAMEKFDPNRGEFGAYLYYTVKSCRREEARRRGRLNTVPLTDEVLELPAEFEENHYADLVPKLLAGLEKLRPLDRELLRQRFWLGRTIEEIVQLPEYLLLGLRPHHIKTCYGRALAGLRRSFTNRLDLCPSVDSDTVRRSCLNPKRVRTSSPKVPPARKINTRPTCVPQDI